MVASVTGLLAACRAASAVARRVFPSRGVRSPTKSRFSICWPFMAIPPVLAKVRFDRGLGKGRLRQTSGLQRGQNDARRGRLIERVEMDSGGAAVQQLHGLRGRLRDP